jgi:ApaG protein
VNPWFCGSAALALQARLDTMRSGPKHFLQRLLARFTGTSVQPRPGSPADPVALASRAEPRQSRPVSPIIAEPTSTAVTDGIRVTVESVYLPQQSSPRENRYVFAYTVSISNEGADPAQLRTRHWIITDGNGVVQEVKGPGVVGETPRLVPGQSFKYTSGCVLKTPVGTMHGTYQMYRDDGTRFDAEIAPFTLASPARDPQRMMN